MENNTSFCRKQAVVLRKSYALSNRQNRLLGGFALKTLEFSWERKRVHQQKTCSPSSSGKNSFNLWLSTLSTR